MGHRINAGLVVAVLGLTLGGWARGDAYAPPVRPSAPTEQADLSAFSHLTQPISEGTSTIFMLVIAVLVLVVLGTLAAVRMAGTIRAQGVTGWSWTLSAKIVTLGGFLLAIVTINAAIFTHVNRQSAHDAAEAKRLLDRVALLDRFDRAALEARIHARGFLLFERNEDVTLFLNSFTAAATTLAFAQTVTQDPADLRKLDEMKSAKDQYGAVITRAVGLTDKIGELSQGRIEPQRTRLAELLATLPGLSDAERSQMEVSVLEAWSNVSKMILSGSTQGAPAVAERLRAHERTLRDVAQRQGAGDKGRASIEEAATLLGSMAGNISELHDVIGQRFEVIFSQCPPAGARLGELALDAKRTLESRVASMKADSEARAEQLFVTAMSLVAASLLAVGVFTTLVIRGIRRQMSAVIASADRIGRGDLRPTPTNVSERDEFGLLHRQIESIAQTLRTMLGEVATASTAVNSGAVDIQAASQHLSDGMNKCEQQTQQVSAAIEELSTSVGKVLQQSRDALVAAETSGSNAQRGGEVVGRTITEMHAIAEQVDASARSISALGAKSEEIGRIISVINDIAEQTNLLALNAAIEAARAGEHGRGFAVVADEVRKLAERTTQATNEVGQSIRDIQNRTNEAVSTIQESSGRVARGVELASGAGTSLKDIVSGSDSLRLMVQTIATASDQQSHASADVARSIDAIAEVSRSLSSSSQQTRAIADAFTRQAGILDSALSRFKL